MINDRDDHPSMANKGREAAKQAVHAASHHVDEVGQHLRKKLDAAKRPQTYLQMLKDVTKGGAAWHVGRCVRGRSDLRQKA